MTAPVRVQLATVVLLMLIAACVAGPWFIARDPPSAGTYWRDCCWPGGCHC
jgi:hypothetical protein